MWCMNPVTDRAVFCSEFTIYWTAQLQRAIQEPTMFPLCSPGLIPKQHIFLQTPALSTAGTSRHGLMFLLTGIPSASARFRSPGRTLDCAAGDSVSGAYMFCGWVWRQWGDFSLSQMSPKTPRLPMERPCWEPPNHLCAASAPHVSLGGFYHFTFPFSNALNSAGLYAQPQ